MPGGESREALLVDDRGDAEPGVADQATLLLPQPLRTLGDVDGTGAIDTGQVPEPVLAGIGQAGFGGELTLERRDRLTVVLLPEPDDLGELLFEGHPAEQVEDAVGRPRGGGRVAELGHEPSFKDVVGWVVRRDAVGTGQPFTAPWRPLTMRRCMTRKKTRAGIIARDVKAKTPAVSEEYWDEKSATPRGSVFMSPCSRSKGSR